jgi:3-dehydroquinate dehydratase-2
MRALILNGPNLNMLGFREPEIYGHETLQDLEHLCHKTAQDIGLAIDLRQSNHEGTLVDWIQDLARGKTHDGLIINAGAYTHTSVALHDALRLLDIPIIEVHISDPKTREPFRHTSYIEPLASAVIAGKGVKGYGLALQKLTEILGRSK